jgi:hypothetical protein
MFFGTGGPVVADGDPADRAGERLHDIKKAAVRRERDRWRSSAVRDTIKMPEPSGLKRKMGTGIFILIAVQYV